MTLIIYKNMKLYADRIVSYNGEILGYTKKIHKIDNTLIAAAGNAASCYAFMQAGLDRDACVKAFAEDRDFKASGYHFTIEDDIQIMYQYNHDGVSRKELVNNTYCIGLPEDYAEGLIYAGKPISLVFDYVNKRYPIIGTVYDTLALD